MFIQKYITTLRPEQWIKNLLILLPAFFGIALNNSLTWKNLLIVSIGFCFIASFIYIINDVADKKRDQKHPIKSQKPIAKGLFTIKEIILFASIVFFLGFLIIGYSSIELLIYPLIYIIINLLYSFFLKAIPIIDILCVTSVFLLRIYLGGTVANIPISNWLSILIAVLSIYILLSKRLNRKYTNKQDFYAKVNLNKYIIALTFIIIGIYYFYTTSTRTILIFDSNKLWITVFPVALGLGRYTLRVLSISSTFEPIKFILSDKIIMISLMLWLSIFAYVIYG